VGTAEDAASMEEAAWAPNALLARDSRFLARGKAVRQLCSQCRGRLRRAQSWEP
jgi:hypothetical protein